MAETVNLAGGYVLVTLPVTEAQQRAFAELERRGLVYSQRTAGRLVTEDAAIIEEAKRELARRHIHAFREAMEALGFEKNEMIDLLGQEEGDI